MPWYSSLLHNREHEPPPTTFASSQTFGFLLWSSSGFGLVGKGCVGESCSPLTEPSPCGTGRSTIGHTSWPFLRLTTKRNPIFVACIRAGIFLPLTVMFIRVGAELM